MGRLCSLGKEVVNIHISGLNIVEWGHLEDEELNGKIILNLAMGKYVCKKDQRDAHFFLNNLFQLYCTQHVSNKQLFIIKKPVRVTYHIL